MTKFLRALFCSLILSSVLSHNAGAAEVTTVIEADFTILEKGTPESPVSISYIGSSLFYDGKFSGYFASGVYEAGGALFIKDGGYIQLPRTDLSANGGVMKVIVEAKVYGEMGALTTSVGYSSANQRTSYFYDSEWHTVELIVGGGTSTAQVKLAPFLSAEGIFIRKVTVQQSEGFIAAPAVRQPTKADGTSFTATWSSVEGATEYFIDVYSYSGDHKQYFLRNENCGSSLSKEVTGLDADKTYYYVVRAANYYGVSSDSEEIRVVPVITSVPTPENLVVTAGENGNYSASWNAVDRAVLYEVTVSRVAETTEDGPVAVLSEDFSGLTEGTVSSLEYIYERHLAVLHNPGWTGEGLACANGIIAFAPFNGSWLATPALDLSADNGNVTVKLNMAGGNYGIFNDTEVLTVELVDGEEVLDSKDVNLTTAGFADYSVALTGATANTKVKLVYSGSQKLYFEDLTVEQVMPAGTVVKTIYVVEETENNSYDSSVPQDGAEYFISVVAACETVSGGNITYIYSDATEPVKISAAVGLDYIHVGESAADVRVSGPGEITVSVADPCMVAVYDIAGRLLASVKVEGTAVLNVPVRGVMIVKVGAATYKLAF